MVWSALKRFFLSHHRFEFLLVSLLIVLSEWFILKHLAASNSSLTFLNNWKIPGSADEIDFVIRFGLWFTFFMVAMAALVLSFLPRLVALPLWASLILIFLICGTYRYVTLNYFDSQLILFNSDLLTFGASWNVILESRAMKFIIINIVIIGALLLFLRSYRILRLPSHLPWFFRIVALGVLFYVSGFSNLKNKQALLWADQKIASTTYLLIRNISTTFAEAEIKNTDALAEVLKTPYPLVKKSEKRWPKQPSLKPNIIFIFLESFPGSALEKRIAGREVTPNLNRLRRQSLSVKNFFSNSIQTSPGMTATLCGLIPHARSKIMTQFVDRRLRCLPEILQERGYKTIYYDPMDPRFDNVLYFQKAHGFQEVLDPTDSRFRNRQCNQRVNFGLRDDCLYEQVFLDLEARTSAGELSEENPFFLSLLTTVTHNPFIFPKDEANQLVKGRMSYADAQVNVAALADQYFGQFLDRLSKSRFARNTLLVVLGDHSYAAEANVSGFQHNEFGLSRFHIETPMMIYWPGHVKPSLISDRAFSQIDMAPTLLDILNIEVSHPYTGTSLLNTSSPPHFIPVVQPYTGGILASIRLPYFYKRYLNDGHEELFVLDQSPLGETKVPLETASEVERRGFDETLLRYYLNEILLKENRIFFSTP